MIAGPNGSGKSTLIANLLAVDVDFGLHFNADDIARDLGPPGSETSIRAQQMVREGRSRALADRRDYSWETVMSHPSHIEHLLEARAAGYVVQLIYVATEDPDVSVHRVAERVAAGGHDVPTHRIINRYHKSLALLPRAILVAHGARLIDNSSEEVPFRLVAKLDEDMFETLMPADRLPLWVRPAVDELYRHQA